MASRGALLAIFLFIVESQHVAPGGSCDATGSATDCASSLEMEAHDDQAAEKDRVSLLQGGLRGVVQKHVRTEDSDRLETSRWSVKDYYNPFVPTFCSSHVAAPSECDKQTYSSGAPRCKYQGWIEGLEPRCNTLPPKVVVPKDPHHLGDNLTVDGKDDFKYFGIGDYLLSPNGYFQAILQNDCNFVVYARPQFSGETFEHRDLFAGEWKPGHDGRCRAAFQGSDGNFVVYFDDTDPAQIGSRCELTDEHGPVCSDYQLRMQDDGNLVAYTHMFSPYPGPRLPAGWMQYWSTGTVSKASDIIVFEHGAALPPPFSPSPAFTRDWMGPGHVLLSNQSLVSSDGYITLKMQSDCNLVMYAAFWAPLWASATEGKGTNCSLHMDWGNLWIINNGERVKAIFQDQFYERCDTCARMTLQNDANLVYYGDRTSVQWSARPNDATGICACSCNPAGAFHKGDVLKHCYTRGDACRDCYENCKDACEGYDAAIIIGWVIEGLTAVISAITGGMAFWSGQAAEAAVMEASDLIASEVAASSSSEGMSIAASVVLQDESEELIAAEMTANQMSQAIGEDSFLEFAAEQLDMTGELDLGFDGVFIPELMESELEQEIEIIYISPGPWRAHAPAENERKMLRSNATASGEAKREMPIALKIKSGLQWTMTATNDELNFLFRKVGIAAKCEIRIGDIILEKGSKMTEYQFGQLAHDSSDDALQAFRELKGVPSVLWSRSLLLVRDWLEKVRPNGKWQFGP